MSFFANWFGKSAKKPASVEADQPSVFAQSLRSIQQELPSHQGPLVTTRPISAADTSPPRPGERSARREMVYSAVRESMVRSGILSAGYKFKVLALDKRATQFIVMVDLAEQFVSTQDNLSQIEALIAYSAKSRFEILITSVYWRLNGQLGTTSAKAKAGAAAALRASMPTACAPIVAPISQMPAAAPRIDPVEEAEIEAFKKALMESAMSPVPALDNFPPVAAAAPKPITHAAPIVPARTSPNHIQQARDAARQGGTPAPTPDTNFGGLSATQYGDLN
ncbi:MAG: hypothetical protein RSD57_08985 [Comamonas sp.]